MQNTFLAKTLEHWLTRTSELGYTTPFCEVLISRGYSICHVSRQNAFEQGKDVVAIAPDGIVHAFQLKRGNIGDSRWTTEVLPEIHKLRLYPVVHPSVPPNAAHVSWLVTNGELEDTVRTGIGLLNTTRWGAAPLKTIVRGELLQWFLDASEQFVPQQVSDYKLFLDLYFDDGLGRVDEARFCHLVEDILRLEDQGLPAAERQRNITAAILYSSYILQAFYGTANHVGCLHLLTLLYAAILCAAERYKLDIKKYRQSLDLIDREIERLGALLEQELLAGGLEVMQNPVWDGDLGVFRRQLAVDYFAAFKLHQLLREDQGWRSIDVETVLAWTRSATIFWGEGATPGYALRFWLLGCLDPARRHDFTEFLYTPLAIIARANGRRADDGVASPYYRQEFVLRVRLEIAGFDESFAGRAYTAWPLVELLALYDRRDVLKELWRDLTYISNVDFVAATPGDVFRWRNSDGREDSCFPPQTQSWAKLREQSASIDDGRIPESLHARIHFMPLFLLTFPHRFSKDLVKSADSSIRAIASVSHIDRGAK